MTLPSYRLECKEPANTLVKATKKMLYYQGSKIKENVLTEHKFTDLVKPASPCMTMPHGKGNFDFFSIVDCE